MFKNLGFTIVEVLVAASILAVVCVGIFSLLSGGIRQSEGIIVNSEVESLSHSVRNCVRVLGYTQLAALVGSTGSVNFGTDNFGCVLAAYDTSLSFPGIEIKSYSGVGNTTSTKTYWASIAVSTGSITSPRSLTITQRLEGNGRSNTQEYTVWE